MEYITNVDTTILPYNDTDMRYNLTLRQYELTPTGYQNYTGINLLDYFDSEEELTAFLVEVSGDVYEWIYSMSLLTSVSYKRYVIAKNGDIREDFKKALVSQARYSYRSGGHLLKDQHAVNIEKGKALDINAIRGRIGISPQTESILGRLGLLYSGYIVKLDYEDDGSY